MRFNPSHALAHLARTETTPTDEREAEKADRAGRSGWRRKAALAGVGIGVVALARRLRSRRKAKRQEGHAEPASMADGDTGGSGITRKLGAMVALVVTTAILRSLRRRLASRSNRGE